MATTDYDSEIQRIEDDLERLGPAALQPPLDVENATKFVYRLYQRASLNGNLKKLAAAECPIDTVTPQLCYPDDLILLKANLCFKLHRLTDVRHCLERNPALAQTEEGMKLTADLLFQEGRYRDAKEAYLAAIETNRSWDNIARYAHFISKLEDFDKADALYAEAEDELTSKQMRSYAWVELQRGLLDIARGEYDEAEQHYRTAARAYSGYWMVDEHMAALLCAQGRLQEAADLYEDLVARVTKPELSQALGDVYLQLGQTHRAKPHHDRALLEYTESADRDEVHYYHHLVDYHCAVTKNGSEAVKWARMDLSLRSNFTTQSALAWSLYLAGEVDEALQWISQALASGAKDPHVFSHAAAISRAAGRHEESHDYEHKAAAINHRLSHFHTHTH